MRGRAGAAAWAYPEHEVHARDLRDVPVQGLVEAGGLPARCREGEASHAQARVGAEAAGCRQGGRLVCGGALGQRRGRTLNMLRMLVTCATSQSSGWLKLETPSCQPPCQVWRGGGEEFSQT